MFATLSSDGNFLTASMDFCELIGYTKTEVLSMNQKDLISHNDLLNLIEKELEVLSKARDSFQYSCQYRSKSGHKLWFQINCILDDVKAQNASGFFWYIQDNSKEKMLRSDLNQRIREYRKLMDFFPIGIFLVQQKTLYYTNKAGLKIIEAPARYSIKGIDPLIFIDEPYHEKVREAIRAGIEDNRTISFQNVSIHTCMNHKRLVEIAFTTFTTRNNLVGMAIVNDVNDRLEKEFETKLNFEMLQNYIHYMDGTTSEFRKIRHKYLNILQGISGFLDLEDLDGATSYLKNMLDGMKDTPVNHIFRLYMIHPFALRGLIATKLNVAEAVGISCSLVVTEEINVTLSNLPLSKLSEIIELCLTKAINLASSAPLKILNITMADYPDKSIVMIENTIDEKDKDKILSIPPKEFFIERNILQSLYPTVIRKEHQLDKIYTQEITILKNHKPHASVGVQFPLD